MYPSPRRRLPQLVLVLALGAALLALVVPKMLGDRDGPAAKPPATDTESSARWVIRITPKPEITSSPTPTATRLPHGQSTPTRTPLPAQATPTTPPRQDHYWLSRPIAPDGVNTVARTYPYASRLDGTYPVHHGVEFVNPMGTEILAPTDGTVIVAGSDDKQVYGARDGYYGLLVIIEASDRLYGQPVYVLCGHMSEVLCQVGQPVEAGDVIGLVGMTGYADGPHVHMEVRYGANDYGRTVNPELWLTPRPGYGTLVGRFLAPDGEPIAEARLVLYANADANKPMRYVTTYPDKLVNADPSWGENFGTGDLEPGEYLIQVYWSNHLYKAYVTVRPGETTWVTVRT